MKFNKMKKTAVAIVSLVLVALLSSCGKNGGSGEEVLTTTTGDGKIKANANPTPPPAATSSKFSLALAKQQSQLNLRGSDTMSVTITVQSGITGTLNLSVDRSLLDSALLANSDVTISLSPASIVLDGVKTSYKVDVSLSTTSHAPSFKSSLDTTSGDQGNFRIKASLAGGSDLAEAVVPLAISPVLEIRLMDGNHTWDPPNSAFPMAIRNHAQGVTLRFVNYDTTTDHVVHGNGLIPHQGSAVPLQPQMMTKAPAAGQPGGSYEVVMTSAQAATGSFYCHAHAAQDAVNGSTAVKVLNFNKP